MHAKSLPQILCDEFVWVYYTEEFITNLTVQCGTLLQCDKYVSMAVQKTFSSWTFHHQTPVTTPFEINVNDSWFLALYWNQGRGQILMKGSYCIGTFLAWIRVHTIHVVNAKFGIKTLRQGYVDGMSFDTPWYIIRVWKHRNPKCIRSPTIQNFEGNGVQREEPRFKAFDSYVWNNTRTSNDIGDT